MTDTALADMERIYVYIADTLQAPENARWQYNCIAGAILTSVILPECFALSDTEPERSRSMRKTVVDNYLFCYPVDPGIVTITDVLYGASNVHARLKERHIQLE